MSNRKHSGKNTTTIQNASRLFRKAANRTRIFPIVPAHLYTHGCRQLPLGRRPAPPARDLAARLRQRSSVLGSEEPNDAVAMVTARPASRREHPEHCLVGRVTEDERVEAGQPGGAATHHDGGVARRVAGGRVRDGYTLLTEAEL